MMIFIKRLLVDLNTQIKVRNICIPIPSALGVVGFEDLYQHHSPYLCEVNPYSLFIASPHFFSYILNIEHFLGTWFSELNFKDPVGFVSKEQMENRIVPFCFHFYISFCTSLQPIALGKCL